MKNTMGHTNLPDISEPLLNLAKVLANPVILFQII